MNLKRMTMYVVFGLVLAWSPFSFGDDVMPPDWRGDNRTVFAEWDFAGSGDAPDSWVSNPGGLETPYYTVADSSVFHESYEGRQDVWEINEDHGLDLYIPNFPDGYYKEISVQLTYLIDENVEPTWVFPDLQIDGDYYWRRELSDWVKHDDYWITDIYWFEVEPNPVGELISFYPENQNGDPYYPTYIDQVVVDTICHIPEPAILALFLTGSMFVFGHKANSR